MTAPPALEISALCKVFKKPLRRQQTQVEALHEVTLRVPPGCAFGLIGLNGAGKTTLIKIALGIQFPSAGEVRLLGRHPQDPKARRSVGYLPERLLLPAAFSAIQFLQSCARFKAVRDPKREAQRQLTRVGLSAVGRRSIKTFSKGMRQRLALAAALLGSPKLLVLDEPTDGIDPLGRIEVRAILEEEQQRGTTLFLNSHLLAETERICDRIGILSRGRLLREGSLTSLATETHQVLLRLSGEIPSALAGRLQPVEASQDPPLETPETTHPPETTQPPGPATALAADPGQRYSFSAESALELNQMIDALRAAQVLILELQPQHDDLEAILSKAIQRQPSTLPEASSQDGAAPPEAES